MKGRIDQKIAEKAYIIEHTISNIDKAKEYGIYHVWAISAKETKEDFEPIKSSSFEELSKAMMFLNDRILFSSLALGVTAECDPPKLCEKINLRFNLNCIPEDIELFKKYFWDTSEMKPSDWHYYLQMTSSKVWVKAINKSTDYISHFLGLPVTIDPVWRVERIFLDSNDCLQEALDRNEHEQAAVWWKIFKEAADILKANRTNSSSIFSLLEKIERKYTAAHEDQIVDVETIRKDMVVEQEKKDS